MKVSIFSSWEVKCGIYLYTKELINALNQFDGIDAEIISFDRQLHPRSDYAIWGKQMNRGDVAHIQHEYSFFGYLLPWKNYFHAFASQIQRPLVITRHVTFDGPLEVPASGGKGLLHQTKWSLYNRWLGSYARYLNKDTFDIADQIIVLSKRLKDHLEARHVDPEKIHVIPAGVPALPPATPNYSLRTQLGWQDKRVICQFGYIAPPKGHLLALDALSQLPEEYVYLIAGGVRIESHRDYLEKLEKQIDQRGLKARVYITGFLPESKISSYIGTSDILIYPNTHADFSYSVVVGLAHHTVPALASDIYGHREIAGYCPGLSLFESGNAAHLAYKIQEIVTNDNLRQILFERVERYCQNYSWESIAQRTVGVYQQARDAANKH